MIHESLNLLVEALPAYDDRIRVLASEIFDNARAGDMKCLRIKCSKLGQISYTRDIIQEELDSLVKYNFRPPVVGDYLCFLGRVYTGNKKPFLMIVTEIAPPVIPRRGVDVVGGFSTAPWRSGYIKCDPLTMYGAVSATGRAGSQRYTFSDYSIHVAQGTIKPAPYILTTERGYTEADAERILPMLPFYRLKEGQHLSIVLLRQLAREARKTVAKLKSNLTE